MNKTPVAWRAAAPVALAAALLAAPALAQNLAVVNVTSASLHTCRND